MFLAVMGLRKLGKLERRLFHLAHIEFLQQPTRLLFWLFPRIHQRAIITAAHVSSKPAATIARANVKRYFFSSSMPTSRKPEMAKADKPIKTIPININSPPTIATSFGNRDCSLSTFLRSRGHHSRYPYKSYSISIIAVRLSRFP